MVRQFSRSAIRDCAVCRIGALWPSSRPATTTAMTPEACTSSAATYAANGTTSDMPLSSTGSVRCRRTFATTRKITNADDDAPAGREQEVQADLDGAEAAALGDRERGAERDQRGRVVEQRLALEDRDDPPGQPDPAADRGRRHGVGRCDHGADRQRDRPRDAGQQQVRDQPDAERRERHQPDREQQDRPPVGLEVDQRGALRGGVQQRRQQPEEHDVLGELDLRHHRDVRRRDADQDQQERRRARRSARPPRCRPAPPPPGRSSSRVISTADILPTGSARVLAVPLSAQSGSQAGIRAVPDDRHVTIAADTFADFVDHLAEVLDETGDRDAPGEEWAARFHFSRFHFDRMIRSVAGEPPQAFRRRILLERAAYRMVTTTAPLIDIAVEAGLRLARGLHPRLHPRVRRPRPPPGARRPAGSGSPRPATSTSTHPAASGCPHETR